MTANNARERPPFTEAELAARRAFRKRYMRCPLGDCLTLADHREHDDADAK